MPSPVQDKSKLRRRLRDARLNIANAERQAAAAALVDNVEQLPEWNTSKKVAIYFAARDEVDTGPLVAACRTQGKLLYLPVIQENSSLEFALWTEGDELNSNRFGIPEPATEAPRTITEQLDVIFMPLVGWDLEGNRLGMGGGFYDRSLAGINGPLKVGLAFDRQRANHIPTDPWDVSLDFVATEVALNRCGV